MDGSNTNLTPNTKNKTQLSFRALTPIAERKVVPSFIRERTPKVEKEKKVEPRTFRELTPIVMKKEAPKTFKEIKQLNIEQELETEEKDDRELSLFEKYILQEIEGSYNHALSEEMSTTSHKNEPMSIFNVNINDNRPLNSLYFLKKIQHTSLGQDLILLGIANCQIEKIEEDILTLFPKLKNLDLHNNLIKSVGSCFGVYLVLFTPEEQKIGNHNDTIKHIYSSFPDLEDLNLAGNQIEIFNEADFYGLCSLETLNLRNNPCHRPEYKFFLLPIYNKKTGEIEAKQQVTLE